MMHENNSIEKSFTSCVLKCNIAMNLYICYNIDCNFLNTDSLLDQGTREMLKNYCAVFYMVDLLKMADDRITIL